MTEHQDVFQKKHYISGNGGRRSMRFSLLHRNDERALFTRARCDKRDERLFTFAAFLFIFLLSFYPLFALDPAKSLNQYGHIVWLRHNGLPSNAVKVVKETHDGYLWFGTSAGLFRFDGVSFTKVNIGYENANTYETISSLTEASDGGLWIGTGYNGLRQWKNGIIKRYGKDEGFFDTQVKEIHETRAGKLLIGTAIGVFLLDHGSFIPIFGNPNFITAIAEDQTGNIWIGTHNGVHVLSNGTYKNIFNISARNGLQNEHIETIYIDHQGSAWIGTFDGLNRWKNGSVKRFTINDGLADNHINVICQDRDDNIWVGTQKGLSRLSNGRWTTYRDSDGLTDNDVLSIAEDHEGSLWIGTSDGLNQFKNTNVTTWTTYDGLANNYISSIVEAPGETMFFLSIQGANVTQIRHGRMRKYNIPVGPSYCAKDGSLWIGQSGFLFNIKNNILKQYDTHTGLPAKWISAITEDEQGLLMYIDHTGIFRFNSGRLSPYVMKSGQQYPASEYVVCFYPQRKGLLWAGTTDSLVKIENGVMTGFTTKDGLAGNWVSSFSDDQHGGFWISSPQGGLTHSTKGRFIAYNSKAGLFTDEIYCVLTDNDGNLWLSSPQGIGNIKRKDIEDFESGKNASVTTKVYLAADGMKTDECFGEWPPAGWKTHDGHIWFATKRGAAVIDPGNIQTNMLPPPVLIEKIVADEREVSKENYFELRPRTEKVEFHYTALSYLVPERVKFKYQLEGYDHDWVDAGTRRVAFYTNLPAGKYRFRVMACNNDGLWNEAGVQPGFELLPHFYQTYWFTAVFLLFAAGALFGIYRLRVWQLLHKEKELQEGISEALANIKTLSGLIPICANCKKIRDDKGYWDNLEGYIQEHSTAKFSHGICPECAAILYPEYAPSTKDYGRSKS